jgi:hypothetical protein
MARCAGPDEDLRFCEIPGKSVEFPALSHVTSLVKNKFPTLRLPVLALMVACAASSVSCITTYDAYGRPVQSVDPALAVAGVAAAGILGYAVANNNSNHYHGGGGYYYGGGYYRGYRPCY